MHCRCAVLISLHYFPEVVPQDSCLKCIVWKNSPGPLTYKYVMVFQRRKEASSHNTLWLFNSQTCCRWIANHTQLYRNINSWTCRITQVQSVRWPTVQPNNWGSIDCEQNYMTVCWWGFAVANCVNVSFVCASGIHTSCVCTAISTTTHAFTWYWSMLQKENCIRNYRNVSGLMINAQQRFVKLPVSPCPVCM